MNVNKRPIIVLASLMLALSPAGAAYGKKGGGGEPDPVTIDVRRNLDFGDAAGDGTLSGTVALNPVSGAKTVSGGAIDFGGRDRLAKFRIKGEKKADVYVVLPGSVTINTSGGTMTLNNFTMDRTNPVNLGKKGRANIKVGATLNLSPGQSAGDYNGSFTIYADY